MQKVIRSMVLFSFCWVLASGAFAQGLDLPFGNADFDPKTEITHSVGKLPESARTGEAVQVNLTIHVPHGYHITKELFELASPNGAFEVAQLTLPPGEKSILGEVLGGDITAKVTIVPKQVNVPLTYALTYQACSEGENAVCFPPVTVTGEFHMTVTQGEQSLADRVAGALGSSMLLALLLIFIGGIGASLTPCVYPVIPLTVAYVGARSEGNKLRGFVLSVMLVLGIATTYSILGIISAETGAVFGSIAQHPAFIITLALVFIAMALSMFGFYDIQLPASINTRLQVQRKGLLGAYLMGMATGVLAAPCVGPIIVVLLGWVAQTGSMFKGFLYLFDFALGMGVLFVVIGTFSGVLASLPKAGNWMITVKYVFGVLFMLAAVLFAKPVLGSYVIPAIAVGLLPLVFVLIAKSRAGKWTGVVFLVLFAAGLIGVQQLGTGSHDGGITDYQQAVDDALARAGKEQKLVILDFYADWCAACKELDEYTWSDEAVKQALDQYAILLKLDFTKLSDAGRKFQEKYQVVGLPTVVFLDKTGQEQSRFVGFVRPKPFLELLNRVVAGLDRSPAEPSPAPTEDGAGEASDPS